MGKTKKTQSEWSWFLTGAALSLALYLGGHLLLASLLVRGAMGEGSAFPVTAALCLLTSAAGALLLFAAVVLSYQAVGTLGEWLLTGSLQVALQDFRIGIPGMLLQIIGGWLVVTRLLRR